MYICLEWDQAGQWIVQLEAKSTGSHRKVSFARSSRYIGYQSHLCNLSTALLALLKLAISRFAVPSELVGSGMSTSHREGAFLSSSNAYNATPWQS